MSEKGIISLVEAKKLPHHDDNTGCVLDYLRSVEVLSDPESRREHFAQMSGEAMLNHIQCVRSLIETGSMVLQYEINGDGVSTGSLQPPFHEDKEGLLKYAWEGIREGILLDGKYTTEEALQYAGLVAGGAVVLTHLFMDGNGRASRLVASEIMYGSSVSEDQISELLTGGEKALYVRPPQDFALRYMPMKLNDSDQQILRKMLEHISPDELQRALRFQYETGNEELTLSVQEYYAQNSLDRECYRKFLLAGFMAWVDVCKENPNVSPNNELTEEFLGKRIELYQRRQEYDRVERFKRILCDMRENYGDSSELRKIPYLQQYKLRSQVLSPTAWGGEAVV